MQSTFQKYLLNNIGANPPRRIILKSVRETLRSTLAFPEKTTLFGPLTTRLIRRTLFLYSICFGIAALTALLATAPAVQAFAMGLMIPGGGFLLAAGPENTAQAHAVFLYVMSVGFFAIALFLWFATGNVLAPILVWLSTAFGASVYFWGHGENQQIWNFAFNGLPLLILTLIIFLGACLFVAGRQGLKQREVLNSYLRSSEIVTLVDNDTSQVQDDELTLEELQLQRLLLDRALQPVEDFNGFEWLDQFQTASVRYQLNFTSYALSMVQARFLPAFAGYMQKAQKNLIAKQQDPRIWGYWKWENMWGNLRLSADPISRDNIMFSGFAAAQIAYANNATCIRQSQANRLTFANPKGEDFSYSQDELIRVLVNQYENARYGLLSCEPNWVYPLCNFITVTAIRAHDNANGTTYWPEIADGFRRHLENEFVTAAGRLVPLRSSYTGLAFPSMGGVMMQAFPCYFLNALFPDIAERQWQVLRRDMKGKDWRKAAWPIDIGNYTFSRATSYAATAAAAGEIGDDEIASIMLDHLEEDHPFILKEGVAHRPAASLWAHAIELIARCGQRNAFQRLVTMPTAPMNEQPYIVDAAYPEVLVAKAKNERNKLEVVLYPGGRSGFKAIIVAGLVPGREYTLRTNSEHSFHADGEGRASLNLPVHGRTVFQIARKS